jgi:hypothetical protein
MGLDPTYGNNILDSVPRIRPDSGRHAGPSFNELAVGLFGSPRDLILMLWAYMDETGLHEKTGGRCTHLAVGGAIAEFRDWRRLSRRWKEALKDENLCEFHMTDFEASEGEFKGWSQSRHEQFLNRLLTIILECNVLACLGVATNAPQRQKGRRWFPPVYKSCVKGLAWRLIEEVERLSKRRRGVHAVFAHHPQIRFHDLAHYFQAINDAHPNRVTITTAKPCMVLPLQVADLVIYETVKWFHEPNRSAVPERYPLRHLKANGMRVLLDARIITG